MIYMISDFHFGHSKILEFERTQFADIKSHDAYLLSLWQQHIHKNDTVYFLGDFGYLDTEKAELFKNLNGKKLMIKGNHDTRSTSYYLELGFEQVSSTPLWLTKRIVLSHEPIPVTKGTINVHGHLHNATLALPNYINANVHMSGYRFITEKELMRKMSSLPKDDTHFLHEWYAPYYQFINHEQRNDVITDEEGIIDLTKTLMLEP